MVLSEVKAILPQGIFQCKKVDDKNMASALPLSNISFEEFLSSNRLIGVTEVSLPDFEFMNVEEIQGSGVAGKFSAPIIGFLDSAEMELTWRTIVQDLKYFSKPEAIDLTLYGAMETYDHSRGKLGVEKIKITTRAFNKKLSPGSLKAAKQTETKTTLEMLTCKIEVGGKVILDFDKINYKYIVDGTDYLQSTRSALGI